MDKPPKPQKPPKTDYNNLRRVIKDTLGCWEFDVSLLGGAPGARKVKVLLTKAGWLLGGYDEMCQVCTGCNMEGVWKSQLVTAWKKRNKETVGDKEQPRALRFGRRAGDIILPEARSFSGRPDFDSGDKSDRSDSVSSRSRRFSSNDAKAFQHALDLPFNPVTDRQLEVDKDKAASYSGRTIEAHHVVEDNIFEKLQLKHPVFSRSDAITVALNPEFHQRFLSLKRKDRESFSGGEDSDEVVEQLAEIYDDLYQDQSLAELHKVSLLIIGAVRKAMD